MLLALHEPSRELARLPLFSLLDVSLSSLSDVQGARPSPSLLSSRHPGSSLVSLSSLFRTSRELARLPVFSFERPGSSPVSLSSLFQTSRELARLPLFSLSDRPGSSPISLSFECLGKLPASVASDSIPHRLPTSALAFRVGLPVGLVIVSLGLPPRPRPRPSASASAFRVGLPRRPRPSASAFHVGLPLTRRKHRRNSHDLASHGLLFPSPFLSLLPVSASSSKQRVQHFGEELVIGRLQAPSLFHVLGFDQLHGWPQATYIVTTASSLSSTRSMTTLPHTRVDSSLGRHVTNSCPDRRRQHRLSTPVSVLPMPTLAILATSSRFHLLLLVFFDGPSCFRT